MNKLLFLALFIIALPVNIQAQKHAPTVESLSRNLPGIYPEASQRLLRFSDVKGLNSWDLKVMRNEIFARHGFIFQTDDMVAYFSRQKWYRPRYKNVSSLLTPVEKKNINFIKNYE